MTVAENGLGIDESNQIPSYFVKVKITTKEQTQVIL